MRTSNAKLESVVNRRHFMSLAARGVFGIATANFVGLAQTLAPAPSQVAVTQGDGRAQNIFDALKRIEPSIKAALATKKRVVIKPNLVSTENQLSATHAECLEGLLEFLTPLTSEEIVVAETSANAATVEGYDHYGYPALANRYRVRFLDLDDLPFERAHVVNERHHAVPIRFSTFLTDPDTFVISTANFKTHDRAVVTLGIKNLTVGGILKDKGFRWGAGSQGSSDKHLVHGGPENQGIHYNLFTLSQKLRPHLTVLDGFQGMEHNGPVGGEPVDHRVAVASTDFLAADCTAARLMGFDPAKIGYLVFCAQANMGAFESSQMEILGPQLEEVIHPYRPHDSIEQQYRWM
ncbi:MAG: hypothetical protein AMXMBFR84_15150 [Candidatus Hydrogenedentota bacterium]